MKAGSIVSYLYNPGRLGEEELLARFIVRQNEFRVIWEDIRSSTPRSSDQHFLITGQRGMGKTTLMLKVAYEVKRDAQLKEWLLPVIFPEELYGVPDLLNLWLKLGEVLEAAYPERFPELSAELEVAAEEDGQEARLLDAIRARLEAYQYKLLILIDNFGDLLDRLSEKEIRRLRALLMTANDLRLIAASARVVEQTYQYEKPFYDFFYHLHLHPLNKDAALGLIQGLDKLLDGENVALHMGRIEAIRRLTGGVPRVLMLLYGFLQQNDGPDTLRVLEHILDQVTPYYKHRVEDLPQQQRDILHYVAMAWDAVGSGEVAEQMHVESRKISAQMAQMVDSDILEKIETGGRNHLYRLQERFFNIWYLMRMAGFKGSARMKWLLAFLESWLEGEELADRMKEYSEWMLTEGRTADSMALAELMAQLNPTEGEFGEGQAHIETKRQRSSPDVVPFNISISRSRNWEEAMWAFEEMIQEGVSPDVVTFSTLISRAPNWEMAIWAFAEMTQQDVSPNVVTFGTLISRAPNWEAAMWAFKEMTHQGVSPDVVTFNTLICRASNWEAAMWAFKEMLLQGVSPDVVTFNALIDTALNWKAAMWAFEEMAHKSVSPDVITFSTLISRAPNWKVAMWAFKEMTQQDVSPDVVTFSTMINRAPNWEATMWAFEEMSHRGFPPNNVIFIAAWTKVQTDEEFLSFLEWAKHISGSLTETSKRSDITLQAKNAILALWRNEFDLAHQLAQSYFHQHPPKNLHLRYQRFYLLELLIRHQQQECLWLFENTPHQLKEVFKPIWYALMKLLGPEGHQEFLRMGPELSETVDEIVDFVLRMREKYPS